MQLQRSTPRSPRAPRLRFSSEPCALRERAARGPPPVCPPPLVLRTCRPWATCDPPLVCFLLPHISIAPLGLICEITRNLPRPPQEAPRGNARTLRWVSALLDSERTETSAKLVNRNFIAPMGVLLRASRGVLRAFWAVSRPSAPLLEHCRQRRWRDVGGP